MKILFVKELCKDEKSTREINICRFSLETKMTFLLLSYQFEQIRVKSITVIETYSRLYRFGKSIDQKEILNQFTIHDSKYFYMQDGL